MTTVKTVLGSDEVSLRATYGAASQVEEALSSPVETIYEALRMNGLTYVELARIVKIGMDSAGEASKLEDLVKHMFTRQAKTDPEFRESIAEFLLALAWSPENREKKLREEWRELAAEADPNPASVFQVS